MLSGNVLVSFKLLSTVLRPSPDTSYNISDEYIILDTSSEILYTLCELFIDQATTMNEVW
jgi:hypothetical protein